MTRVATRRLAQNENNLLGLDPAIMQIMNNP